jgi:hypothetical protein
MKYLWLLIPLLGIIFYYPSLFYGFSQDDFIHLYSSRANSVFEFLNFFNPYYRFSDIFFYRPLATQFYFFANTTLFGLNPISFRIESLIFHILNGILFYFVVQKIFKDKLLALLSAVFYEVSAIHFLSLFYISSFQQIARTFFVLLSIFLYIQYIDQKRKTFLIGSVLSFVAAILSKETSIILPLLLPLVEIIRTNQKVFQVMKTRLISLSPFFLITLIYLIIRALGIQSVFDEGNYEVSFSLSNFVQNLKWYFIWSFGLPEILATYPSLAANSLIQFTKDFSEAVFILSSFILLSITLIVSSFILIMKHGLNKFKSIQKLVTNTKIRIYLLIFFIPLLPVIFLYQHKYPQYLDLSFIVFIPLLALIFLKTFSINKFLAVVGICSFLVLQFFSLKLTEQTHWTTHRSKTADYYNKSFLQKYSNISENSSVSLIGNRQALNEVSHALAGKYAFLVWYPYKIGSVDYSESEAEIENREKRIIFFIDKY